MILARKGIDIETELLNEKLLVWAGFVKADIKEHYYWVYGGRRAKWTEPVEYRTSEGHPILLQYVEPPSFPDDIGACFRWIAPKLTYWRIESNYGKPRVAVTMKDPNTKYGWPRGEAEAETIALAFSQAVKRMLDNALPTS